MLAWSLPYQSFHWDFEGWNFVITYCVLEESVDEIVTLK